LTNQTAKTH